MRVLIAEDEPTAARLLTRELESQGYQVFVAANGRDALELAQKENLSLVLTDWIMPEMDGLELCRALREHPDRSRYHYVIMISSRSTPKDRENAMEARIDDFLVKPYDQGELRARLGVARRVLEMQDRLHKQNEALVRSQEELLQANLHLTEATEIAEYARNRSLQLFEELPVAGFTYDTSGSVFEWNRRAETVFGINAHEVMGRTVWDVLGSKLVGKREKGQIHHVFEGGSFEDSPWSDGTHFFLVSSHCIRNRDGVVVGAVSTAVDVTQQRRAELLIERQKQDLVELNGRLQALAVTDGLTGIPNHRAFQERLQKLTEQANVGLGFSLAMVDVDHFKHFNDTYGHQAGDEVLRKTAECLIGNLRGSDFVARYGGEEFAILFRGIGEESAAQLCDRLRARIEAIETPYSKITASFGVAAWGSASTDAEDLIVAADQALYCAKRGGRNRVCSHSELEKAA
ncbi:MAG: diguanylate cyclase [Candidatus Eisenbacteria bacterium]